MTVVLIVAVVMEVDGGDNGVGGTEDGREDDNRGGW